MSSSLAVLELNLLGWHFRELVLELRDKERNKAIEGVLFIGDVVVAEDFLEAVDDAVFGPEVDKVLLEKGRNHRVVCRRPIAKEDVSLDLLVVRFRPNLMELFHCMGVAVERNVVIAFGERDEVLVIAAVN